MKNRGALLLAMLTGMFACGLIGFFIGRNLNRTDIYMSGYVEPSMPDLSHNSGNATDPTAAPPSEPLMININTATAEELDLLPGIGPTLAQRIVDYRTSHGPFSTVSELTLVEGIGISTLEVILDYITAGG